MFLPLRAERIFLVWSYLVITGVAACQKNKTYKFNNYSCQCVHTANSARWHINCFLVKPKIEVAPPVSPLATKTTHTEPNALGNTTESVQRTESHLEPKIRTQRIHSTKLSSSSSLRLISLPRSRREIRRETEHIGKDDAHMFTIIYDPSYDSTRLAHLEIQCYEDGMEYRGLLEKLKDFQVIDVGEIQFRGCPVPKNLTYGEILEGSERKIKKFTLHSPDLDVPTLPKAPFVDYAPHIKEFSVTESKQLSRVPLEGFEDGFFDKFSELTSLSLTRNQIKQTQKFQFIPNLNELILDSNPLKVISAESFRNLTKLQHLDLVDCDLTSIEENAFATLINLRKLDLFRNHLTNLPPGLFNKTIQLDSLRLSLNDFKENLPENIFANLAKLQNFTCEQCLLTSLKPKTFYGNPMLERLDLSKNEISALHSGTLSKTPRLRYLNLSSNNLTDLEGLELPPSLWTLDLAYNKLKTLPEDLLLQVNQLETLNLMNNSIESLSPKTFTSQSRLKTLNLSGNLLTKFSHKLSSQMIEIRVIDLSNNRLYEKPDIFPFNIVNFHTFKLNNNKIRYLKMTVLRSRDLTIDVRSNELQTIDVTELEQSYNYSDSGERIKYLIDGPLKCDCHLLEFHKYYKYSKRPWLGEFSKPEPRCEDRPQTPFESIPETDFRCPLNATGGCPQACSCDYTAADRSIRVDCSRRNLTTIPPLPENVTEVSFAYNSLTEIPDFQTYSLLRDIDLSNNEIHTLSGLSNQFNNQSLRTVSLAYNHVTRMGKFRKNNYTLDLTGNRFLCNCDTWQELRDYFLDVEVKDRRGIECNTMVNQTYLRLNDFINDRTCDPILQEKSTILFASVLVCSVCLLLALIVAVYYKNRRRIIVYMFTHHYNIYVLIWPDSEVDCDKTYDAFVSFSDKDLTVVNEIITELEKPDPVTGEQVFKLCLHYRDWIAGNSIVYNIVNSVQNSRRTILVLSENFITSVWLNVEFRAALTQMIEDRSHKLIIIVIGELPSEKKLDKELQDLLQNTYLKWGNPNFWDNLRYLLPHKPPRNKGIDKTKAVLNGHPMTRILLESRPTSANLTRTAETLENEKNRLKSIAQTESVGKINEAYVAVSTEDISVHCDSFKDASKPRVTSGRNRPSSDNAVRPPRKKDKRSSEA